ncbi:MAG: hypothetical protein JXA20_10925 [Spirochaetes bacterium]|nr:hypothetical protein [Spirochaetota bacterium]
MKRIVLVMVGPCILLGALFAQDSPEILSIRKMYNDTRSRISGGELYAVELSATLLVVPGIGSPRQRAVFYHSMNEGASGDEDFHLCFSTSYYQHAGRLFYEEMLFDRSGALLFFYGKEGNGEIESPGSAQWQNEERFYFWKGKCIRCMTGDSVVNNPGGRERVKGELIMKQARAMRALERGPKVPLPVSFLQGR